MGAFTCFNSDQLRRPNGLSANVQHSALRGKTLDQIFVAIPSLHSITSPSFAAAYRGTQVTIVFGPMAIAYEKATRKRGPLPNRVGDSPIFLPSWMSR